MCTNSCFNRPEYKSQKICYQILNSVGDTKKMLSLRDPLLQSAPSKFLQSQFFEKWELSFFVARYLFHHKFYNINNNISKKRRQKQDKVMMKKCQNFQQHQKIMKSHLVSIELSLNSKDFVLQSQSRFHFVVFVVLRLQIGGMPQCHCTNDSAHLIQNLAIQG